MRILILSGHHRSSVALKLINLVNNSEHKIVGIYIKKITFKRILYEVRRDGLQNVFFKFYFKAIKPIFKYNSIKRNFNNNHISSLFKLNNIPVKSVSTFNIDNIYNADIILYTGGGYVPSSLLSKINVINCHMGILPYYRGIDVVEWPIYLGDLNNIGLTTHFMTRKIDMGNIIKRYFIDISKYNSIDDLRANMLDIMPMLLFESLLYLNEASISQFENDGKTYYKMSPILKNKLSFSYCIDS
jgi:methionyl-tRNA formyltransferase